MSSISKSSALDAIDARLLDLLQTDASQTNQTLAERAGVSPATALRRIARLQARGFIERTVAILNTDALAPLIGHGLEAIVEISLDRQDTESLAAFERRVITDDAVQQCWRTSPGPDFVLIVRTHDMPGYQALAQRLFNQDANVRNVKAFFALKRAKFKPNVRIAHE